MALPGDPRLPGTYAQRQNDAEGAYQQALASLAKQQESLYNKYGFKGQISDTGNVGFEIDPNKQYGLAQRMLSQHQGDIQNLRTDLTGRGLGTKGLAAKRTGLLKYLQGGDLASLMNNFVGDAGGILNSRNIALTQKNSANTGAEQDALDWIRQNPQLLAATPQAAPPGNNTGNSNVSTGTATDPGQAPLYDTFRPLAGQQDDVTPVNRMVQAIMERARKRGGGG
jgi:hypothetical protein